jgi:hypothetical protein
MPGLGLALLVTLHAAALDNGGRVCRHAGEVKNSCDCPHDREQTLDGATLSAENCCKVRTASTQATPTLIKGATPCQSNHSLEVCSVAKLLHETPQQGSAKHFAAREQSPPSTPLYLSIRNLLI